MGAHRIAVVVVLAVAGHGCVPPVGSGDRRRVVRAGALQGTSEASEAGSELPPAPTLVESPATFDGIADRCRVKFHPGFDKPFGVADTYVGSMTTSKGYIHFSASGCCQNVRLWVKGPFATHFGYGGLGVYPDWPLPLDPGCDTHLYTTLEPTSQFNCVAPGATAENELWMKLFDPDTGEVGVKKFTYLTEWNQSQSLCTSKSDWLMCCLGDPP